MGQVQSHEQGELYFALDSHEQQALVENYIELTSSAKGAKVLETSNELLGEGYHLIKSTNPREDKDRVTTNGVWVDGWETRRHNKQDHHSAIIRLACPGFLAGFDIDTSFVDGNHPQYASVEGCLVVEGADRCKTEWETILPKVPLNSDSHHYYGLQAKDKIYTHIKLNMYPDGGIARFHVYGNVSPIFPAKQTVHNLASLFCGAQVIKASDVQLGNPMNLILPVQGTGTHDGWQTRRSRDPDHHDWVIIKLGDHGMLDILEVDTAHFEGAHPVAISLDACSSAYNDVEYDPNIKWINLLQKSDVRGDQINPYHLCSTGDPYSHIRLNMYPDGGISRVHVYGVCIPDGSSQEVVSVIKVVKRPEKDLSTLSPVPSLGSKCALPLKVPANSYSSTSTFADESFGNVALNNNSAIQTQITQSISSAETATQTLESVVAPTRKRGRPSKSTVSGTSTTAVSVAEINRAAASGVSSQRKRTRSRSAVASEVGNRGAPERPIATRSSKRLRE